MNNNALSLDVLTSEFITELDNRLDTVAGCADQIIKIPESLGDGQNYLIHVSNDIDLMVSESRFNQPVRFAAPNPEMCGAMVILEGECRMQIAGDAQEHTVKQGQAMLFILGSSECSISYPAGKIKMINFSVPKQLMAQLGTNNPNFPIHGNSETYTVEKDLLFTVPLSPELSRNVQQIYAANLSGEAQPLFINAKVIEILALMYHYFSEQKSIYPGIKPLDLQSIMRAADIVEKEMKHPPSLTELSRLVGINDNKLKKLFKAVFNNTVFGYLKEKRLQRASELLIQGDLTVQQVATMVGFKHTGHFAKSFTESFGKTPAEFKRLGH